MSKNKNRKLKKLTSIPIILRRLQRLASIKCREKANFSCEICGLKNGDLHSVTGKRQKVEAHHVMSRNNKNSPLKFDLRNLICLCTDHHKTGKFSAHKHGLWFSKKFIELRPSDADWILEHTNDIIDLSDRNILLHINDCLNNSKSLDFTKSMTN